MRVIGITGGVGSGKSTVLDILKDRYKACIIKTDDVAKELMEPGKKAYNMVIDFFGENILEDDGAINRKKLAQVVFNNNNKRMVLNSIVHPMVKSEVVNLINEARTSGKYDFTFVEAALLIDDHYETFCDEFWYIYADDDTRYERLTKSRGYSKEKIESIFSSQLSDKEFRDKCKCIIDNSKDIDCTILQLDEFLKV